jgi:uncharacterized protein (UPF0335 family)
MGFIKVTNNLDLEANDLGTHVLLSAQRYKALVDRIEQLETRIETIADESRQYKRIMITAMVTVVTGTIASVITAYLKYL